MWPSGLRTQHCPFPGMGSIPGLGIFVCYGGSQKKKKKRIPLLHHPFCPADPTHHYGSPNSHAAARRSPCSCPCPSVCGNTNHSHPERSPFHSVQVPYWDIQAPGHLPRPPSSLSGICSHCPPLRPPCQPRWPHSCPSTEKVTSSSTALPLATSSPSRHHSTCPGHAQVAFWVRLFLVPLLNVTSPSLRHVTGPSPEEPFLLSIYRC